MFLAHLTLLKGQYCFEKEVGVKGLKVPTLFNEHKLNMGASFFKVIMQSNCKHVLESHVSCNLVTKLWSNLASSAMLQHRLSKYFKLAEISVVMALGSVEDKQCCSTCPS
jgi:hypothetical protein